MRTRARVPGGGRRVAGAGRNTAKWVGMRVGPHRLQPEAPTWGHVGTWARELALTQHRSRLLCSALHSQHERADKHTDTHRVNPERLNEQGAHRRTANIRRDTGCSMGLFPPVLTGCHSWTLPLSHGNQSSGGPVSSKNCLEGSGDRHPASRGSSLPWLCFILGDAGLHTEAKG